RVAGPAQRLTARLDRAQDRLTERYERIIRFSLARRGWVIGAGLATFLVSVVLILPHVKKTFLPSSDVGFYQVTLEAAPGTSLTAMLDGAQAVEKIIL